MGYECEYCGAMLDAGEKCDCGLTEKPKLPEKPSYPLDITIPKIKKGRNNANKGNHS